MGKGFEGKGRGSVKGPLLGASQGAQVAIRYAWCQQVTRHALAVTAEVAGSSPVVPATHSKRLTGRVDLK
jgi:hypothetical protein